MCVGSSDIRICQQPSGDELGQMVNVAVRMKQNHFPINNLEKQNTLYILVRL